MVSTTQEKKSSSLEDVYRDLYCVSLLTSHETAGRSVTRGTIADHEHGHNLLSPIDLESAKDHSVSLLPVGISALSRQRSRVRVSSSPPFFSII